MISLSPFQLDPPEKNKKEEGKKLPLKRLVRRTAATTAAAAAGKEDEEEDDPALAHTQTPADDRTDVKAAASILEEASHAIQDCLGSDDWLDDFDIPVCTL